MGNKGGKVVLTEDIVETISRTSGIETHKIRGECQNFLKDHPRGNMNRRDFRKFLKIALPKIDVKKMEENLFRMYDTNMDGVISMQEFLIVYHIFSDGTPEENLSKELSIPQTSHSLFMKIGFDFQIFIYFCLSPGAGEEISSVDAADVVITPSSPLISTTAGSALSEPAAVSVVKSVVSLLSCDVASLHLS